MSARRKPASRSKIERLRQVAKPVKREQPAQKLSAEAPPLTENSPGPILSEHVLDEPIELSQPEVQQALIKRRWYNRLFELFFRNIGRPGSR
jgi:hypothetical protein